MQLLEIRVCFSCVFHFNDTQDKGIIRDVFKDAGTLRMQALAPNLLHRQLLQFPPRVTFVLLQHAKTLLSCHMDTQRVAVNGHCPICRGPIYTVLHMWRLIGLCF